MGAGYEDGGGKIKRSPKAQGFRLGRSTSYREYTRTSLLQDVPIRNIRNEGTQEERFKLYELSLCSFGY